jgi:hypothetical protein
MFSACRYQAILGLKLRDISVISVVCVQISGDTRAETDIFVLCACRFQVILGLKVRDICVVCVQISGDSETESMEYTCCLRADIR